MELEKKYDSRRIVVRIINNRLDLYDSYNGFNFECHIKNINTLIKLLKELRKDDSSYSANTGHYSGRFIGSIFGNNVRLSRCKNLIEALEDFKADVCVNKEDLKKLTKDELLEKLNSLDLDNLEMVYEHVING